MSASLVGSEMCIRDSCEEAEAPPRPYATRGERDRSSQRGPARAASGGRGCLLYTSDAADDM
eukprot:9992554-Alexandrium_andersonii.AAC.1